MAVTDWTKLSPRMQRAILEELERNPQKIADQIVDRIADRIDQTMAATLMGVDPGKPGDDLTTVAAVKMTYRPEPGPQAVPIDLELQPDGTYAPAPKSHLPTRAPK